MASPPPFLVVKLADFGCAKHTVGTRLQTTVGTNGYIAPEVWGYGESTTSIYSFKVDTWSLGCLLYNVVTKQLPFPDYRQYYAYTEGGRPFPQGPLVQQHLSVLGIYFIQGLLEPLPKNRLGVDQALSDYWLTAVNSMPMGEMLVRLHSAKGLEAQLQLQYEEAEQQMLDIRKRLWEYWPWGMDQDPSAEFKVAATKDDGAEVVLELECALNEAEALVTDWEQHHSLSALRVNELHWEYRVEKLRVIDLHVGYWI